MNNLGNALSFNHRVSKLETEERKQRNYQNLKSPYDGTTWKNFAITRPRNISLEDLDRMSAKTSARHYQAPGYYENQKYEQMNGMSNLSQRKVRQENLRLSGVTYQNKREQHVARVKQDALRRVKLLQDKVLPLLSTQKHNQQQSEEHGLTWQLKMQQRLVRVENAMEKVKNEVEIKYEKRLMEIERQWEERIGELLDAVGGERMMVNGEIEEGLVGNEMEDYAEEDRGESMNGQYEQMMNGNANHYNGYRNVYNEEVPNGHVRQM